MIRSDYAGMTFRTVTSGTVLSLDVCRDGRAPMAPQTRGRTL